MSVLHCIWLFARHVYIFGEIAAQTMLKFVDQSYLRRIDLGSCDIQIKELGPIDLWEFFLPTGFGRPLY